MAVGTYRFELLRKRLNVFTRMLHGVEHGDVRALHRTRVASRRLRELVPVLQLDRSLSQKLMRRLRQVTAHLGSVRELDVLLLVLDELHDSGRQTEKALHRLQSAIAEERNGARQRLFEKLPTAELRRLVKKLEDIANALDPHDRSPNRREEVASRWAVDARIAKRAERLHRAIETAGAVYLPDRLHAVRIAVKKLRYALELRDEFAGARSGADVRALRRAQDVLGRMHDLQMLTDRARQVQTQLTPADARTWEGLDALIEGLEDDCRLLHARYMRERPTLVAVCNQSVQSGSDASASRERRAGARQAAG